MSAPALPLALLCAADYAGTRNPVRKFSHAGMRASIYETDIPASGKKGGGSLVLVIRGSDDMMDWARNLRFLPLPGMGATRLWHRGFLIEARRVYQFVVSLPAGMRPDWISGHSRGAAITQIICPSLGIPGIGFAPPRPLWIGPQPGRSNLVETWALDEDVVPYLGRFLGYRHVGRVRWLPGFGHRIGRYIAALEKLEKAA